jgi:acyl carrier protein
VQTNQVYSQLTDIFREVFDDDSIVLTPETTAADIDGWDSVGHLNLLLAIEARLKMKFKTSEIDGLHNVGQLAGLLEYKLENVPKTSVR